MRVKCEIICLCTVPLEKARQSLPCVHDAEKAGVVNQFFIPVRRRCGRGHKAIFDRVKQRQERLISQATERTQHRRLIERSRVEMFDVKPAVAYAFIVRQVQAFAVHLIIPADKLQRHAQLFGVMLELLPNTKRADNKLTTTLMFSDLAHNF